MPKMTNTRKQKAKRLLTLLQRGPHFSDPYSFPSDMDMSPSGQFKRWSECWVLPLLEELVPELKPRFEPAPKHCERYTVTEFMQAVATNAITKEDGSGVWATYTQASDQYVDCSQLRAPTWATHVIWFNK